MDLQFIKYEKRGRLAYITINRPEVMNALNPQCHWELHQIWDDFAADNNLWIAILSGTGERAFSAGHDLKYSAEHPDPIELPPGGFGGFTARFDINKPIIAAVNGLALGGGFELALASDIVVAAEHARFGLPEPRVGLIAGAGGVHRLPRQIPLKIAMSLMLTGRQISAARCLPPGHSQRGGPIGGSDSDRGAMGRGDHGVRPAVDTRHQGSRAQGAGYAAGAGAG